MAETGFFGQETSFFDALAPFGDGFVDFLFQVGEVLLDTHETVDNPRRAMADLHQAVFLRRNAAGPVARLILVGEQHGEIGLDFRRVLFRIREDDLRDDADCAVDGADVSFAVPFPGPRGVEDRVDDVVLRVGDELEGLGVVDERRFHKAQEVQVSRSPVQKFVLRLGLEHFGRVIAQIPNHVHVLARRGSDGQKRQDIVRDAAFPRLRPRVVSYGVLRLLEVGCGPGAEQLAFDLEVVVHLLEDQEGVGYADGAFEEAARGPDARWRVLVY